MSTMREPMSGLRAPVSPLIRWAALAMILLSLAVCVLVVSRLDPETEPHPWGILGVLTALAVVLGVFAVRVARGLRRGPAANTRVSAP